MPDRPILIISAVAALLAMVGSLSSLVEASSLAFLVTFVAVNVIAWREGAGNAAVCAAGLGLSALIGAVLVHRLATQTLIPLVLILTFFALCFLGRPALLRHDETELPSDTRTARANARRGVQAESAHDRTPRRHPSPPADRHRDPHTSVRLPAGVGPHR